MHFINTCYTAFSVLKNYIKKKELIPVNFSLSHQQNTNLITMWVEENTQEITHFVCRKNSDTFFEIWTFSDDYINTNYECFDYADVNTPNIRNVKECQNL